WRETERISLRRKTFAVLRYLVEHAGQLVTKEQLLEAIWPGTYVGESLPTTCVRELRKALNDEAKTPQFIETVHVRGYRFVASVPAPAPVGSGSRFLVSGRNPEHRETRNEKPATLMVGRETELAQLHGWLDKARNGDRQIVFVTGEPGIGKTSLVEA